ncbi:hypothetical protein Ae717Ps2_6841c [Pseudonocardia sp. Ae717_Ps2]|nr:hypothetical protein Ae717Ps2_6841c [Pseudonocardia sp. Ae717_Ps2]
MPEAGQSGAEHARQEISSRCGHENCLPSGRLTRNQGSEFPRRYCVSG